MRPSAALVVTGRTGQAGSDQAEGGRRKPPPSGTPHNNAKVCGHGTSLRREGFLPPSGKYREVMAGAMDDEVTGLFILFVGAGIGAIGSALAVRRFLDV